MSKQVTIQVLTWNNFSDTHKLLSSFGRLNYDNYQVTVVDNHSTDDSISKLEKDFPDYRYIFNSENKKYSGGTNFGVEDALSDSAEYLFLLNNDTEIIDPNTLNKLTSILDSHPEISVVSCTAYYPDGSLQTDVNKLIFPSIPIFLKKNSLFGFVIAKISNKIGVSKDGDKIYKMVDWVPTGITLFRKSIFTKLLFSNSFPMEFSDVDFCKRMRVLLGVGATALADVKILHTNNFPDHITKSLKNFSRAKKSEFLFIKTYHSYLYYVLYKSLVLLNSTFLLIFLIPLSINNRYNKLRILNYFNLLKNIFTL